MPAKGIATPWKAESGRLVLLEGDEFIRQLILAALGGSESTNAFQDLGLGEDMIFDQNKQVVHSQIEQRIEIAFAPLVRDQLAKYVSSKIEAKGSEAFMEIEYENLENGDRSTIKVPYPNGGIS